MQIKGFIIYFGYGQFHSDEELRGKGIKSLIFFIRKLKNIKMQIVSGLLKSDADQGTNNSANEKGNEGESTQEKFFLFSEAN